MPTLGEQVGRNLGNSSVSVVPWSTYVVVMNRTDTTAAKHETTTTTRMVVTGATAESPWSDWGSQGVSNRVGNFEGFAEPAADEVSELMIRLFELRGAIETLRGDAVSPTMSTSRSIATTVSFGDPADYRSMHFLTGYFVAELSEMLEDADADAA